jgi:hypothetical protein
MLNHVAQIKFVKQGKDGGRQRLADVGPRKSRSFNEANSMPNPGETLRYGRPGGAASHNADVEFQKATHIDRCESQPK